MGDDFEDKYLGFVMADDEEACIELLKEAGDTVANNLISNMEWSAMHIACNNSQVKVVDFLIKTGRSLDCQDINGATPLHRSMNAEIDSAIQDDQEIFLTISKKLIDAGASEAIKDSDMRLPRDIAAAYGKSVLRLYDAISWNDYTNEIAFDEVADFCIGVLNDAGYSTQLRDGDGISVAKSCEGHKYHRNRFFLGLGSFFKYREDLECLKLKLEEIAKTASAKFEPKFLGKSKWKA